MISKRSVRAYLVVNLSLISISYAYYMVLQTNLLYLTLFTFGRNLVLIKSIELSTSEKAIINKNYQYPDSEFIFYIVQASGIEALTTYCLTVRNDEPNLIVITLAFIPMSFVFEIIFDFFYYWSHRFLHVTHASCHKTHHAYIHLKPAITFYQDWMDLLLTVSLPFLLAAKIVQIVYPLSWLEISLLLTYKIFIEISGHSGRVSKPTSSFSQCIWLPQLLGIELYSENHNLHHVDTNYNYAKQFSLWDKAFGTFAK